MGLVLKKKVGDYVKRGDVLCVMHANDRDKFEAAKKRFLAAYSFGDTAPGEKHIIVGKVE